MNAEVEAAIRSNLPWSKLSQQVQQQLGNSAKEYEKAVVSFSIKNQVRFRGNLVRQVRKDEKKYYGDLLHYSRTNLMLFPYHLSDVVVKGMLVTPFQYYSAMMETLMAQEKSYDSLPNFTAADCLRLLGIGRNQYIDLMNQSRSTKKPFGFFRGKSGKDLLPSYPVESLQVLPWWVCQVGFVTEDDMRNVDKAEHALIDQLIDNGSCPAGHVDHCVVVELYRKGLIYFDVPVEENDYVIVPPLEGFVMNRVLGDYFETLLYKIFVSIDENTTVKELATVLEIDVGLVRDAVSLYCRLGFARRKNSEMDPNDLHPSWYDHLGGTTVASATVEKKGRTVSESSDEDDSLLRELNRALEADTSDVGEDFVKPSKSDVLQDNVSEHEETSSNTSRAKKIAFLFDSTLTAYLMMGNLSPGLKNHAVTMFEVGKLSDETLDSLVAELEKVHEVDGEGEAAKYFYHAITLRDTVLFLRQNQEMKSEGSEGGDANSGASMCLGVDLIRCESLQSLDQFTVCRLLSKNYSLLVSMAPLSNEIRPVSDMFPPHLGPAIPEISSVWFKLFVYHVTGSGPPTLLLAKGSRLTRLPRVFDRCSKLLVTSWGHDPSEIPLAGALTMLLDALQHSAVLVQGIAVRGDENDADKEEAEQHDPGRVQVSRTTTVAFPFDKAELGILTKLGGVMDLKHSCGYVTLLDLPPCEIEASSHSSRSSSPINGKVGKEQADLLAEELDSISLDPKREDKIKGMRLELPDDENNKKRRAPSYTLLDVNFGIPLFDSKLNKDVCRRIVSCGLWKKESLDAMRESSRTLCDQLLDFIRSHGGHPIPDDKAAESRRAGNSVASCLVAFPTKNIFFDGRSTHLWSK